MSPRYILSTLKLKMENAFHRFGIASPQKDERLIALLANIKHPIQSTFNPVHISFTYWNHHSLFAKKLDIKDDIALAETGEVSSPLTTGLYALTLYNDYVCLKDQKMLDSFFRNIDHLIATKVENSNSAYWEHKEDIPRFAITGSWTSSLTQAISCSALLRAYYHTKEESYLSLAEKSMQYCFQTDSIYNPMEDGLYWAEEYPSANGLGAGVLNGFLFFLIGLSELHSFRPFQSALDNGFKSLIKLLPEFQYKKHLKYASSLPEYSNVLYQTIHYFQLIHLSKIIDQDVFLELANLWKVNINWKLVNETFGSNYET